MKNFATLAIGLMAFVTASIAQAAPTEIDMLVLYIDEATQTSNGRDIDARIAAYVEHSNQAYQNSEVDMRLRLVGVEKVNAGYTYVDSNNLSALRTDSQVAEWRQQYGADLVTLINLRKPMNGGYVCGIGYVPPGNESTGQFYSNAPSAGFSLVGVDCGYNTFTHELGHNMSLGHSHKQGSEGGIYPWARGYGEYGIFSTIMAYPQEFGTRNQLQQFSSPLQPKCEGRACGIDRNQPDGADSVENLSRVAVQVANFVPTVENGGGDGELPICSKPELENNLIQNGDFTELTGWNSFNQAASLTKFEIERSCGRDYLLLVQDRTQFYSGPIQTITPVVEPGAEYRLSAKLGIANGASRDNVRVAFQIRDESGTHYQYLPELSVTQNELSSYSETFEFDVKGTLSDASVVVYGPQAGVSFLVDELKLEKVAEAPVESKLIVDQGFENGASGWGAYFSTSLSYSRTAKEGNYGLLSSNRSSWHSGPGFNVHGALTNGGQYSASVDVYLGSSSLSADDAGLWLYFVDDKGGHWQQLTSRQVSTYDWQSLETTFTVEASGPITQMRMHVFGPQPATNLYIDNLRVTQ